MLGQKISTGENPGFWEQVSYKIEHIWILKLNKWDIKNNRTMEKNTLYCSIKPLAQPPQLWKKGIKVKA